MRVERSDDKFKVFVSYARNDLALADQMVAALSALGYTPVIDRQAISAGEDWQKRLGALIEEADTVVFLLSPDALKSTMCSWEIAETTRLCKRLLPVVIEPLADTPVPQRLQALNYIFFYHEPKVPDSGFGTGIAKLADALNTDIDWVREHTRLGQRASDWHRGGRSANRLLSGDDIGAARSWLADRPPKVPEPTSLLLEYIRASQDAQSERESSERLRLEEMATAQAARESALAETEVAQNEREAALGRLRQRTRIGIGVAGILAFVAIIFAVLAETQRREAEVQRMLAVAQRIATEGELALQLGSRSEAARGALLVLESLRRSPDTLPGQRALASALTFFPPLVREFESSRRVAISPDGRHFAVAGSDDALRIRSVKTGMITYEMPSSDVFEFSDNGRFLATAGHTSQGTGITLWNVATGERIREFQTPGNLQAISYRSLPTESRVDRALLAASRNQGSNEIYVWDVQNGELVTTLEHRSGDVVALDFSPNGQFLGTAGYHRQIEENVTNIWDLKSGQPYTNRDHYLDSSAVAFSHNGRLFAAGGHDGRVQVWQLKEEEDRLTRIVLAETVVRLVQSLAFSPDDRLLAIGGAELRLWDFRADRDVADFDHQDVHEVSFIADGKLASASPATLRFWDLRRGINLGVELGRERRPLPHQSLLELLPEICRRIDRYLVDVDWTDPPFTEVAACAQTESRAVADAKDR